VRQPPAEAILAGAEIRAGRTLEVDVCVIGSGAGGAPAAKELAEGGLRVAVLEEGVWESSATFTARPREMTSRLYRDAGQTVTVGDPPIVLPLGRAIGGTTLVNSGTCFRTPPKVLAKWRDELGFAPDLEAAFARVEEIVGVAEVPAELAGDNAAFVRAGAERLGLSGGFLRRNARGCVGSGVCAFGCPSGAKQHVGVTYMPLAWEAGALTVTGARAERIVTRGGRIEAVTARTAGGGALTVRCAHAIVACGTLLTPLLLRRSGLGTASGQLGRNLSIHPASAARAVLDHEIDPWRGVPQSYYVDQLSDDGIMLEGISGPPDQSAMSTPRAGDEHRELMLAAKRTATFGVMVSDTARGTVRSLAGRPLVRYDLHADDARRFQRGFTALAEIFFAAGARQVIVPIAGVPTLTDGDVTPLVNAIVKPRHLSLMAFHPLGTARAGGDPRRSVVDPDLRLHGVEGVHVADGSVVPTSLGVNPQITIMALATRLAKHLLDNARA